MYNTEDDAVDADPYLAVLREALERVQMVRYEGWHFNDASNAGTPTVATNHGGNGRKGRVGGEGRGPSPSYAHGGYDTDEGESTFGTFDSKFSYYSDDDDEGDEAMTSGSSRSGNNNKCSHVKSFRRDQHNGTPKAPNYGGDGDDDEDDDNGYNSDARSTRSVATTAVVDTLGAPMPWPRLDPQRMRLVRLVDGVPDEGGNSNSNAHPGNRATMGPSDLQFSAKPSSAFDKSNGGGNTSSKKGSPNTSPTTKSLASPPTSRPRTGSVHDTLLAAASIGSIARLKEHLATTGKALHYEADLYDEGDPTNIKGLLRAFDTVAKRLNRYARYKYLSAEVEKERGVVKMVGQSQRILAHTQSSQVHVRTIFEGSQSAPFAVVAALRSLDTTGGGGGKLGGRSLFATFKQNKQAFNTPFLKSTGDTRIGFINTKLTIPRPLKEADPAFPNTSEAILRYLIVNNKHMQSLLMDAFWIFYLEYVGLSSLPMRYLRFRQYLSEEHDAVERSAIVRHEMGMGSDGGRAHRYKREQATLLIRKRLRQYGGGLKTHHFLTDQRLHSYTALVRAIKRVTTEDGGNASAVAANGGAAPTNAGASPVAGVVAKTSPHHDLSNDPTAPPAPLTLSAAIAKANLVRHIAKGMVAKASRRPHASEVNTIKGAHLGDGFVNEMCVLRTVAGVDLTLARARRMLPFHLLTHTQLVNATLPKGVDLAPASSSSSDSDANDDDGDAAGALVVIDKPFSNTAGSAGGRSGGAQMSNADKFASALMMLNGEGGAGEPTTVTPATPAAVAPKSSLKSSAKKGGAHRTASAAATSRIPSAVSSRPTTGGASSVQRRGVSPPHIGTASSARRPQSTASSVGGGLHAAGVGGAKPIPMPPPTSGGKLPHRAGVGVGLTATTPTTATMQLMASSTSTAATVSADLVTTPRKLFTPRTYQKDYPTNSPFPSPEDYHTGKYVSTVVRKQQEREQRQQQQQQNTPTADAATTLAIHHMPPLAAVSAARASAQIAGANEEMERAAAHQGPTLAFFNTSSTSAGSANTSSACGDDVNANGTLRNQQATATSPAMAPKPMVITVKNAPRREPLSGQWVPTTRPPSTIGPASSTTAAGDGGGRPATANDAVGNGGITSNWYAHESPYTHTATPPARPQTTTDGRGGRLGAGLGALTGGPKDPPLTTANFTPERLGKAAVALVIPPSPIPPLAANGSVNTNRNPLRNSDDDSLCINSNTLDGEGGNLSITGTGVGMVGGGGTGGVNSRSSNCVTPLFTPSRPGTSSIRPEFKRAKVVDISVDDRPPLRPLAPIDTSPAAAGGGSYTNDKPAKRAINTVSNGANHHGEDEDDDDEPIPTPYIIQTNYSSEVDPSVCLLTIADYNGERDELTEVLDDHERSMLSTHLGASHLQHVAESFIEGHKKRIVGGRGLSKAAAGAVLDGGGGVGGGGLSPTTKRSPSRAGAGGGLSSACGSPASCQLSPQQSLLLAATTAAIVAQPDVEIIPLHEVEARELRREQALVQRHIGLSNRKGGVKDELHVITAAAIETVRAEQDKLFSRMSHHLHRLFQFNRLILTRETEGGNGAPLLVPAGGDAAGDDGNESPFSDDDDGAASEGTSAISEGFKAFQLGTAKSSVSQDFTAGEVGSTSSPQQLSLFDALKQQQEHTRRKRSTRKQALDTGKTITTTKSIIDELNPSLREMKSHLLGPLPDVISHMVWLELNHWMPYAEDLLGPTQRADIKRMLTSWIHGVENVATSHWDIAEEDVEDARDRLTRLREARGEAGGGAGGKKRGGGSSNDGDAMLEMLMARSAASSADSDSPHALVKGLHSHKGGGGGMQPPPAATPRNSPLQRALAGAPTVSQANSPSQQSLVGGGGGAHSNSIPTQQLLTVEDTTAMYKHRIADVACARACDATIRELKAMRLGGFEGPSAEEAEEEERLRRARMRQRQMAAAAECGGAIGGGAGDFKLDASNILRHHRFSPSNRAPRQWHERGKKPCNDIGAITKASTVLSSAAPGYFDLTQNSPSMRRFLSDGNTEPGKTKRRNVFAWSQ